MGGVAFNVCQVTLLLLGGRMADRWGRKQVFLWGMALFTFGSIVTAVAPALSILIAARVAQAVGAAMVLPASLASVLPMYPQERHPSVVAFWSSMGAVGSTVAPTISASLLSATSWRVAFAIVVPLAVAVIMLGIRSLPDSERDPNPKPLDTIGATLGTAAVGGLAFALVQGRVWGWASPAIVAVAVAAIVSGIVFGRRSLSHPEPLVDLRLFKVRTFAVASLAAGMLGTAAGGTWFSYPLFMRGVWGFSVWQIGLGMSPGSGLMVFVTLAAGRIVERYGFRRPMLIGSLFIVTGMLWLTFMMDTSHSYLVGFVPGTLQIGMGMGLCMGPMNAAALKSVPPAMLGAANGAYNTVRSLGAAFGVALAAALLGTTASASSFTLTYAVITGLCAIAPIILLKGYPADAPTSAAPTLAAT